MRTCKAALRVIRGHLGGILGYLLGTSALMVILSVGVVSMLASGGDSMSFSPDKATVAVIDRDSESGHVFGRGLRKALEDKAELVEVRDDLRTMQDAVATDAVKLMIIVPEGYAADLAQAVRTGGDLPQLETVTSYSSGSAALARVQVDGFVSAVRSALSVEVSADATDAADTSDTPNTSDTQSALSNAIATVANNQRDVPEVRVVAGKTGRTQDQTAIAATAFGTVVSSMIYPMMAALTLAVGLVVTRFTAGRIRSRLAASPATSASTGLAIMTASGTVGLMAWVYYSLLSLAMLTLTPGGTELLASPGVALALVAALALTVMALAFGFMVGQFGVSTNALSGISNVVSLAFVFLSSAWVPASMMAEPIVAVCRFTPGWWFVQAVYDSFGGRDFVAVGSPDLASWGTSVGILLLFAAAFASVGLAVGRLRARSADIA